LIQEVDLLDVDRIRAVAIGNGVCDPVHKSPIVLSAANRKVVENMARPMGSTRSVRQKHTDFGPFDDEKAKFGSPPKDMLAGV
jgi:hypothetical protein